MHLIPRFGFRAGIAATGSVVRDRYGDPVSSTP